MRATGEFRCDGCERWFPDYLSACPHCGKRLDVSHDLLLASQESAREWNAEHEYQEVVRSGRNPRGDI